MIKKKLFAIISERVCVFMLKKNYDYETFFDD